MTSKPEQSLRGALLRNELCHGHAPFSRSSGGGSRLCWPRKVGHVTQQRNPAWVRRLSLFSGKALKRPARSRAGGVQEGDSQDSFLSLETCCWPWQDDGRCGRQACSRSAASMRAKLREAIDAVRGSQTGDRERVSRERARAQREPQ